MNKKNALPMCKFAELPDGRFRCANCGDTYGQAVFANCFPEGQAEPDSCTWRGRSVRVVLAKLCGSRGESHNVFLCKNPNVAGECVKSIRGRVDRRLAVCIGCEYQEAKTYDDSQPGPFGS